MKENINNLTDFTEEYQHSYDYVTFTFTLLVLLRLEVDISFNLSETDEKKIIKDEKMVPVEKAEEISAKATVTDGEVNAGSEPQIAMETEPTPPQETSKVTESHQSTPTSSSVPNKPAKRRITPIAID